MVAVLEMAEVIIVGNAAQLVAAPGFGPSSDRLGLTSLAWAEAGELEPLAA